MGSRDRSTLARTTLMFTTTLPHVAPVATTAHMSAPRTYNSHGLIP